MDIQHLFLKEATLKTPTKFELEFYERFSLL